MTINIPYLDSLSQFGKIIILASILSIFCTSLTETVKNLFAGYLCSKDSSVMIAVSGIISMLTGIFWALSFAGEDISFMKSVWLGLTLWLGSQGFFIMLEDSDGFLGKYFNSLEELSADDTSSKEEYESTIEELKRENSLLMEENERLKAENPPVEQLIPRTDEIYFSYPVNYIAVSTPFSKEHYALDLGWSRENGGANQPVYASFSGTVDMAGYFTGGAGNMVRIYFDDKINNCRWYAIYKHLSKIDVLKGRDVLLGDKIGNMGNTGDADGNHLHFDLIKTAYGAEYTQTSANRAKYSVDPMKYLYAYPDQIIGNETDEKYDIKRLIQT